MWRMSLPHVSNTPSMWPRRCKGSMVRLESSIHLWKITLTCVRYNYMLEDLIFVKYHEQVYKQLPRCEHIAMMGCYRDPSTVQCSEIRAEPLDCCTRLCRSTCSQCQSLTSQNEDFLSSGRILRRHHAAHPCERLLYCEHKCNLKCHSKDQYCNASCQQACRQQCVYHKCPKPCSEPCSPCMEPCIWSCVHMACPVVCGSVRQYHLAT